MEWVKLGEITEVLDNRRVPLNNERRKEISELKLFPYCGANGVIDYIDEYIFNDDEEILCVAEDGGSWGYLQKCSYIMKEKCWVNNHAHVLKAKSNVNIKFLNYYLNFRDLNNHITGTTRGKLTQKEIKRILIPKFKFENQNVIVNTLNELENIIEIRKEQIQAYDDLIESLFFEILNKSFIKEIYFDDMFEIIDGDRGKNYPKKNDLLEEGYCLFLNTKNVTKNGFKFDQLEFITEEKDKTLRKGRAKLGDFILTTRGTVGNIAFIDKEIEFKNIRINSGMVILRKKLEINPKFFEVLIRKTDILVKAKSGSAQPQLPIKSLKKVLIPTIDVELQNKFADYVLKIEEEKKKLNSSLLELEDLFDTLMEDAFSGNLFKE